MEELKELLEEIIERLARLERMIDPASNYFDSYYEWLEEVVPDDEL